MTPPVPGTGRRSSKDTAKARAAEHASIALHRRINAAWTLPCKMKGEDSARALARAVRKVAVSLLHLPPTSAANPCPTSFTNKFWVRALLSTPGNLQYRHGLQPSSWRFRSSPSQDPCHGTRCTMVAKHIKLAATSAGAHGKGKR